MTRARRTTRGALVLGVLLLAGCKEPAAERDPSYAKSLPTMEDVDDGFAAKLPADRVRVPYGEGDAIKGAAEPLVTIVEFSDFQCPFCGTFAATLEELLIAYPEDVRIVFKQYPMPMHPNAPLAAKATIAAGEQGYFWAMHDRLFRYRGKLDRAGLLEHAEALGLDEKAFEAALDDPNTEKRLAREQAEGRRLGVQGTPAFFVNGVGYSGAVPPAALAEIVEAERSRARAWIEQGIEREALYARIMRAARPAGAPPP